MNMLTFYTTILLLYVYQFFFSSSMCPSHGFKFVPPRIPHMVSCSSSNLVTFLFIFKNYLLIEGFENTF